MSLNPVAIFRLYVRSLVAYRYAATRRMVGQEFGRFGRQVGRQLLMKGVRAGLGYLLTPVNILRYFEFPFAFSCLPKSPVQCLDVSSPRLFSLYAAHNKPATSILIINPDSKDLSQTAMIISKLRMSNIRTKCSEVDILTTCSETYDCIWSISVVEHISGEYDDSHAVKLMYAALADGGRLILTVPVDRKFRDEYRDCNYYGTQTSKSQGDKYFFQRVYDKTTLWERLLSPIGKEPSVIRWFGETQPGRYAEYERRWMTEGSNCTVEDPREITDHYREFSEWDEMPGMGVCGLMIEKTGSCKLTSGWPC